MVEKYRRRLNGSDAHNPVYAAMVESVDQALGRLRAKLEQLKIADRTLIVVTSDNGGLRYEGRQPKPVTDNSPLRAGKGHLYEGGIREPLLVYWPGVTKAGSTCDVPVSSIDYFPTIVEIAGGRLPGPVDGVSLAPLFRGSRSLSSTPANSMRGGRPAGELAVSDRGLPRGQRLKRDALYWHYPHYSNQGGVPSGAVRSGEWKLIEFYEDGRLELFHLPGDPGERRNLVGREPKRAGELHGMLKRWRESVKAVMPSPNPNYDPEKADQGLTGVEGKTEVVK